MNYMAKTNGQANRFIEAGSLKGAPEQQ